MKDKILTPEKLKDGRYVYRARGWTGEVGAIIVERDAPLWAHGEAMKALHAKLNPPLWARAKKLLNL